MNWVDDHICHPVELGDSGGNKFIDYTVKIGEWYYFGIDGSLEFKVVYKKVKSLHWDVKITNFEDQQYIDSLFIVDYNK